MLHVQATVLPAPLVHTRQGVGQFLEQTLVYQLAVLLTAAGGVPVFDFVEAVKGSGDQQCLPAVLRIAPRLKDHFRDTYIQLAQALECIALAQHREVLQWC